MLTLPAELARRYAAPLSQQAAAQNTIARTI